MEDHSQSQESEPRKARHNALLWCSFELRVNLVVVEDRDPVLKEVGDIFNAQ